MAILRLHRPLSLHSVIARTFVVDSAYFNPKETAIVISDTTNPLMKVIEIYQAGISRNYRIPIGYISYQSLSEFINSGKVSFGNNTRTLFSWDLYTEEENGMRTTYCLESNNIPLHMDSICAYRLRNEHYTSEVMFGKVDDRYYVLSTDERGHIISISLGVLNGLEEVLIQFREENGLSSEPACRRFNGVYENELESSEIEVRQSMASAYYSDTMPDSTISSTGSTWHRL